MQSLRDRPHKTLIAVLRDAVTLWRQRQRWSVESAANEIVEHYYQSGFDYVWAVEFQRTDGGRNVLKAMKANGERLARWLDDQTKDTTLLPANLVPMVLSALPADLRLMCLSEIFEPLGMCIQLARLDEAPGSHTQLMSALAKENGEGMAAFALLAEQCSRDQLLATLKEIEESRAVTSAAADFIRQRLGEG